MRVDFPEPGGPMTTTTTGGGTSGLRSVTGAWSLRCPRSSLRCMALLARPALATPNACDDDEWKPVQCFAQHHPFVGRITHCVATVLKENAV